MKTQNVLFFLILLITGMAAPGCSSPEKKEPTAEQTPETWEVEQQIFIKKMGPDTFLAIDKYYHDSNVLVAKMQDGSVLISSSPFETVGATALIGWIQQTLKPIKIIAVNTHFHADGTGGNAAYKKAGAEIWASRETQKLLKEHGSAMKKKSAAGFSDPKLRQRILSRVDILAPHTFSSAQGKVFSFPGEEVRVIYPGPAHSADNVVVYFPERQLLFGGCMVKSMQATDLGYTGDANLKTWPRSAHALELLGAKTVIPGHGSPGGPELIEHTIALLEQAESPTSSPKK